MNNFSIALFPVQRTELNAQYNTIQFNSIQFNSMQCNAMQCNAMQVLLAWTVTVSCACDWFSGWPGCLFCVCAPHNYYFEGLVLLFFIYVMLFYV